MLSWERRVVGRMGFWGVLGVDVSIRVFTFHFVQVRLDNYVSV